MQAASDLTQTTRRVRLYQNSGEGKTTSATMQAQSNVPYQAYRVRHFYSHPITR